MNGYLIAFSFGVENSFSFLWFQNRQLPFNVYIISLEV
jgi:hypothetical protein